MAQLKDTVISGSLRVTDTIFSNDLNITSLTASYAVLTDENKKLVSRGITNNTSAVAITASTNLITANTLYYHTGNSNITTVGTITSGTWNGSAITATYLPTATTSDKGIVQVGTGLAVNSGTISVSYGAAGADLASSGSAGSANSAARSDHTHPFPALTSCTGTLTVSKGGTGAESFTANSLIMSGSTTTSALTTRAITNTTTLGSLGGKSSWASDTTIPTINTLAYWDGSYESTNHSTNLRYLSKRINIPTISGGTGTAGKDNGSSDSSTRYCPATWKINASINPVDGDIVAVKVLTALHSYGTMLSLDNGANYHPIVCASSTLPGNWYNTSTTLLLRYDANGSANVYAVGGSMSTSSVSGVWRVMNVYDSGNDNTISVMNIRIGSGSYTTTTQYCRYVLSVVKDQTHIIPVNADKNSSNNNGTTSGHNITQEAFNIFEPIIYNTNNATYAANSTPAASGLWYASSGFDLRYSFNNISLTSHKDVYIKAVLESSTTATFATSPITQTLPSTNDGYIYIKLGRAYSSTNTTLSYTHPIYWHDGTSLRVLNSSILTKTGNINTYYLSGRVDIVSAGTNNRARLELMTISDNPNDFYFGVNNTDHWSITCRSSTEYNFLGIYSLYGGGKWAQVLKRDGNVYFPQQVAINGTSFDSAYGLTVNNGASISNTIYLKGTVGMDIACQSTSWPQINFSTRATPNTDASSSYITVDAGAWGQIFCQVPSKKRSEGTYVTTHFSFREYRKKIVNNAITRVDKYEEYLLPDVDDGTDSNDSNIYYIRTSKDNNYTVQTATTLYTATSTITDYSNMTSSTRINTCINRWWNSNKTSITRGVGLSVYNSHGTASNSFGYFIPGHNDDNTPYGGFFTAVYDVPYYTGVLNGTFTTSQLWKSGDSITGAVWNDYAEYRNSICTEPGYCVYENGDDTLSKTTERLQHFAGIISDTWGFSQGKTETAKTPIAVSGRVLAYTYRPRTEYKPGDCVCAAPNGTVDIMTREEVIYYPDKIVGTVSCVPNYETWGGGNDREPIKINGRIWIKVR